MGVKARERKRNDFILYRGPRLPSVREEAGCLGLREESLGSLGLGHLSGHSQFWESTHDVAPSPVGLRGRGLVPGQASAGMGSKCRALTTAGSRRARQALEKVSLEVGAHIRRR